MIIKQLEYLLEVEKQGSFNKASKSLFVTQPNITKVIKSLEEELGVELIYRNTKSKCVIFTPNGKKLLEYAKSIIDQIEIIEESFKSKKSKFCISSQNYSFVNEVFVEMILNNTEERFEYSLIEAKLQDIIENVFVGKSDIGFICIYDNELANKSLEKKGIVFNSLLKVRPHIFIRKNHPLAFKEIITINDLNAYTAIFFDQEVNLFNYWDDASKYIKRDKIIKVTDRDTIYTIIQDTDAYNIGSGIINTNVKDKIIAKPIQGNLKFMDIGYIMLKNRKMSEYVEKFIEDIKNILKKNTV